MRGERMAWAVGVLLTATEPTCAQSWQLALSQGLAREDNLLRLATPDSHADTARVTGLAGGVQAHASRQQWSASWAWERHRHDRLTVLDHDASRWAVAWDTQMPRGWEGRLSWRGQQDLAPDGPVLDPVTGERREQQLRQGSAWLSSSAVAPWGTEFQLQRDEWRDSLRGGTPRHIEQDSVAAQFRVRWGGDGLWRLGLREVSGREAVGRENATPRRYEQRLIDTSLQWNRVPGHLTRMRLSWGQGDTGLAQDDRQTIRSAELDVQRQPTGRLSWRLRLLHDEGSQVLVLDPLAANAGLWSLSARRSTDARMRLQWNAGARLQGWAEAQWTDRRLRDEWALNFGNGTLLSIPSEGHDRTTALRVGTRWRMSGAWSLEFTAHSQDRRVLDAGRSLLVPGWTSTSPYRSWGAFIGLRWELPRPRA